MTFWFFFSLDYEFYVVDDYGKQDEHGNWDGLIAELIHRSSFLALNDNDFEISKKLFIFLGEQI